jgi:RNA polymerase sigma-70 factor (ECF subfamily)
MRSWLVAICLNAARSEFRRSQRRPEEKPAASLTAALTVPGDDVADEALAELDRQALGRALASLPEPQRIAIMLVDLGGLTAREAAEVVDVPRGTILARVHRGRRHLAQLLEREGIRDGP